MRALYPLICRLRAASALTQGTVTLLFDGWTTVTPAQRLALGCGLCIALRVLIPARGGGRPRVLVDRLLNLLAVMSVITMTAAAVVETCAWAGRWAMR